MNIVTKNSSLETIISEISEVADYLWQRGWAERNAGNISVNVSHIINNNEINFDDLSYFAINNSYFELAGKSFLVTGKGKRMRDLARKPLNNIALIILNDTGTGYWVVSQDRDSATIINPTSELPTHLGIHQMIAVRGSHEKVILHTHANELIALTQIPKYCDEKELNKLLWSMHPETMLFVPKGVGFVKYTTPGTEEIAFDTIKILRNFQVALWEKHGVFAIGEDVLDTFDNIDILAKSAKIFFLTKSAGYEPEGLSDKELEKLKVVAANF